MCTVPALTLRDFVAGVGDSNEGIWLYLEHTVPYIISPTTFL